MIKFIPRNGDTPEDPRRTSAVSTKLHADLSGDPFQGLPLTRGPDVEGPDGKMYPSWTGTVKRPFLSQNANGSIVFLRESANEGEEDEKLYLMAACFLDLYRGHPSAHCTYNSDTGEYVTEHRGMTHEDVMRHLRGTQPGLLSIPIRPASDGNFLCGFGVGDIDRHHEPDAPVDHSALARLVSELGLPVIVCQSKSPKSAHLPVFWREANGFSCSLTQQLLQRWMHVLGIGGEVEWFPAQTELKEDPKTHVMQVGNGVNLPYFGNSRIAFGEDGEPLSLMEFLVLAANRRSYGVTFARRDLGGEPSSPRDVVPGQKKYGSMTVESAREIHAKNLADLEASNNAGHWNDTGNATAFFAAMAFAAKALPGTEKQIKDEILKTANPKKDSDERKILATLASGWDSGITQPLKIVEIATAAAIKRPDMPETCLDGRLGQWCRGRLPEFPLAYSWPSILCAAGVHVTPDAKSRVNMYVCLIGDIHSGKSQAQERAHFLFDVKNAGLLEELKSGSGEGLLDKIGDRQGRPVLWWPDELSHLLEKCQIEHSSFPFILNSAYYQDATHLTVAQRKKIAFNARLSLEGGVVEKKFGDSFGSATTAGLYDRFLFSVCPDDFVYSYRPMSGKPLAEYKSCVTHRVMMDGLYGENGNRLEIATPEIESSVWDARDEIQKHEGIEPRVLEIAIRCAMICAAWDGKPLLRAVDMKPHWELARYQTKVRALLQPNPGRNFEAIAAIKILNFLKQHQDGTKWWPWRTVIKATRSVEYGPSTADRALKAMDFAGDVETDSIKPKRGGKSKILVRLALEE